MSASSALAQQSSGPVVRFVSVAEFDDVVFANVDGAFDADRDPQSGEVWYATGGGLVRLNPDGSARRVLTMREGLPTSLLHDVELSPDGSTLWVGSDRGLVRVDVATEEVTYWNPANDPDAPAYVVTLVRVDPHEPGTLWIGTRNQGIARFDATTESWTGKWNTSAEKNDAVLNAHIGADAVWFAARNSGFLRYDRDAERMAPVAEPFAYAFHDANAVLELDGIVYFGQDDGVTRHDPMNETAEWFTYNGTVLSDLRVQDLDARGKEVWVSTKIGISVLDTETGGWRILGEGAGIIDNNVRRASVSGPEHVVLSTLKGLTVLNVETRAVANYITGPTNGPNSNTLLGGAAHGGRVWFGTTDGATAFDPSTQSWLSVGYVDGIDLGAFPVYSVGFEEDHFWLGTKKYVWYRNDTSTTWTTIVDDIGSNLFPRFDVDGDTIWLPERHDPRRPDLWSGLIEYNWRENTTRRYDYSTPGLFDWALMDVHATADAVWVTSLSGLHKLDKTTRVFTGYWGEDSGFPWRELTDIWPDGKDLWIGTTAGDLVRFSTETNAVTGVWNATRGTLPIATTDFLECLGVNCGVRGLVRDGVHVWLALGPDGLVRLEPVTGKYEQWSLEDGLPAGYANDVVLKDGILHVGTHGGLARLDTTSLEWLPMYVGDPDAWLAANPVPDGSASTPTAFPPSVRILDPESGTAVAGTVILSGLATHPGGRVDRVEVSVDDGASWQAAVGTSEWRYSWDASDVTPGERVVLARAVSGSVHSKEDAVSLRVVAPPTIPLSITHTPPDGAAFSGRTIRLQALVEGDEPLTVTGYYQPAGESSYRQVRFERQPSYWFAEIPPQHARDGDFRYFIEARSGFLSETAPPDRSDPYVLSLKPAPTAAVAIEAPPVVDVTAGDSASFTIVVENVGVSPDTYVVEAAGLRASWAMLDPTPFSLQPGERAERAVTIAAPERAYADNTSITFTVRPVASNADPASQDVPLTVKAAAATDDPADSKVQSKRGLFGIPAPGVAIALIGAALAARASRGGERR